MKKLKKIILLGIFTVIIPLPCWAEFYIGGYLGPNFCANMDPAFDYYRTAWSGSNITFLYDTRTAKGVGADTSIIFGGKVGYWFTKESVFGWRCPSWLKHLGFEVDVAYHRNDWPQQNITVHPLNGQYTIEQDGWIVSVCWLFMFRYGFLPDAEVPFGRLQPYLGIGPMIFVSNSSLKFSPPPQHTRIQNPEVDLGFGLEAGLRYMVHKHVSLNMALKYRYCEAHYSTDDVIFDREQNYVEMRPTYNLISIILGAAYHF